MPMDISEKKYYSEMTYTEFCSSIDEDENLILVIGFNETDEWQIWYDENEKRYFYIEIGINDASDFYEVKLIATLDYDANSNTDPDRDKLINLFDCDFCGAQIHEDEGKLIVYWFKKLEVKADDIAYVELVDIYPTKVKGLIDEVEEIHFKGHTISNKIIKHLKDSPRKDLLD